MGYRPGQGRAPQDRFCLRPGTKEIRSPLRHLFLYQPRFDSRLRPLAAASVVALPLPLAGTCRDTDLPLCHSRLLHGCRVEYRNFIPDHFPVPLHALCAAVAGSPVVGETFLAT